MEILKKLFYKLLFPHAAVIVVFVPLAAAMLIYAFAYENANEIVVYLSYFLSAYALMLVCLRAPRIYNGAKKFGAENKYIGLYRRDAGLRVKLSLYVSLAMNVLYALMQLGLGFYNRSVWFYVLAGYYILLSLMRYFLLKETRNDRLGKNRFFEYLIYRLCGILLALMNIALSVIVFYIVWQNRGFEYHYILTIAMAAYTFFTLTKAIVDIVKYRKYESPVMSASKAISLAAALVSMLSLETAMLTAFGEGNDPVFRQIMTACTGAAVCMAVLAVALYMIIHSTGQIRKLRKGKKRNERRKQV